MIDLSTLNSTKNRNWVLICAVIRQYNAATSNTTQITQPQQQKGYMVPRE